MLDFLVLSALLIVWLIEVPIAPIVSPVTVVEAELDKIPIGACAPRPPS
jgi:hypothetical protein